jgi:hypothetical protein
MLAATGAKGGSKVKPAVPTALYEQHRLCLDFELQRGLALRSAVEIDVLNVLIESVLIATFPA